MSKKQKDQPGVVVTGQIIKTLPPEVVTHYKTGEAITNDNGEKLMKGYIFLRCNYSAVVLTYICYSGNPSSQAWLTPFLQNPDYGMNCQVEIGCKPFGRVWKTRDGRYQAQELTVDSEHVKVLRTKSAMEELGVKMTLKNIEEMGLSDLFQAPQATPAQQPTPQPQGYGNQIVQGVPDPFPQSVTQPSQTEPMF